MPMDMNDPSAHTADMSPSPLSLLLAGPHDAPALERLAALDSAAPPREPVLLAYRDGRAIAAVSMADGRAVADPFEPSAEAVELLRIRARQLSIAEPAAQRTRRGLRRAILQLR
jgi:hypothetical protein